MYQSGFAVYVTLGVMMKNRVISRRELLKAIGHTTTVQRSSWSHDMGEVIIFNTWSHLWERNSQGDLVKYPLRTNDAHYNHVNSHTSPGHMKWQTHVDLVINRKRTPQAILPVAKGQASKHGGTKGWLPLVVDGYVKTNASGETWLHSEAITLVDENFNCPLSRKSLREGAALMEGALHSVVISKYERNADARLACIEHYGAICFVCNFSFEETYGRLGRGFIHVHHLVPLSSISREYLVDPIRDLRPVCPNCHAMLHRKDPPLSTKKIAQLISERVNC